MKESFTLWCQPLPNCAQIPSMVSLHYPVCGNSSHPFAAVSLSWLGFTAIVFWTGCTIVLLFVDTAGFAFGTVTSRQGRRLIIPSQFWRKCVTYSYTWHSRYSLLLTGEPHNSFILLEKRCHIWLVKVFPTAHRRSTYSCLAQRNTNSVLVWLQHKLWASPSAHEPLWAVPLTLSIHLLLMDMDVLGGVSIRAARTQRLHFVIFPNTSLSQAVPIKKACNNIPNYVLLWWEI